MNHIHVSKPEFADKHENARLKATLESERQRHAEVRKAALEEAARIAERTGRNNEDDWPGETWIAEVIAKEIRALLSKLEKANV